MGVRYT